jgi:hypothetical protein
MTELELERCRRLIAEGSAASARRHSEFIGECCDLWQEIGAFWKSKAPDGAELPQELIDKARALAERHS